MLSRKLTVLLLETELISNNANCTGNNNNKKSGSNKIKVE